MHKVHRDCRKQFTLTAAYRPQQKDRYFILMYQVSKVYENLLMSIPGIACCWSRWREEKWDYLRLRTAICPNATPLKVTDVEMKKPTTEHERTRMCLREGNACTRRRIHATYAECRTCTTLHHVCNQRNVSSINCKFRRNTLALSCSQSHCHRACWWVASSATATVALPPWAGRCNRYFHRCIRCQRVLII